MCVCVGLTALQFKPVKRLCFHLYAFMYFVERVVLAPVVILKPTLINNDVIPTWLYVIVLGLLVVLFGLQYVWFYQIVQRVILGEKKIVGQGIDTKVHLHTDTHTCVAAQGLHTCSHMQRKEMARMEHQAKREE